MPAILKWPGHTKPGAKTQQVMQMIDVFPTLAATAGVTPQNKLPLDGKNPWPNIQSGNVTPREDLFFAVENDNLIYLGAHHGEWKLVRQEPT